MTLVWQPSRTENLVALGASETDLCSRGWHTSARRNGMAHTHEFDCKVCGAHLDSRQELDKHTREKHQDKAQSGQSRMDSSSRSPNSPRGQD